MTQLMIDCPQCNGDGFISYGDRHVENAKEVCSTCNGHQQIPARTGETPQTSAPMAITDPFVVGSIRAAKIPVGSVPAEKLSLAPLDPVVEAVRADLLRRSQFGLRKYGTPLSRTDLNLRAWLNHAYEEALDFANYLKRSIMELDAESTQPPMPHIICDVLTMRLSDGRSDYFTRIKFGDRECTPYVFKEKWKAQYEADHFAWLFGLRTEEPEAMAYSEETHPND